MRELYASQNGDCWYLVIDEATGRTFVRHVSNQASGGNVDDISVVDFLNEGRTAPEHQAFWSLLRGVAGAGE